MRFQANHPGIYLVCLALVLLSLTLTLGCTQVTYSIEPQAIQASKDVGKVVYSVNGSSDNQIYKKILILEEAHDSRAIQIEIAIMLNRLINSGTKIIALEGVNKGESVNPSWFHELPDAEAKKQVAVRLLKEGEISDAEFIALIYPDVKILGIENPQEYAVDISDKAISADIQYLLKIALYSMSKEQLAKAKQLLDEGKTNEGIKFILDADPWVKEKYTRIQDIHTTYSVESTIALLEEIERKASEKGIEFTGEEKSNFKELMTFYKTAKTRTDTMSKNTMELTKDSPGAIVAFITGAAHSEGIGTILRQEKNIAFALVSPNSMNSLNDLSELTSAAYDRKGKVISVDKPQLLGSYLDNRPKSTQDEEKKLPIILNEPWFKSKTEVYYVTYIIARGMGSPDFPNNIKNKLIGLKDVQVDIGSIQTVGGECIFTLTTFDQNGNPVKIYGRVHPLTKVEATKDIETLLKEALTEVKTGTEQFPQGTTNPAETVTISPDVFAKYSLTPDGVKDQIMV